jgi:rubrerythrin
MVLIIKRFKTMSEALEKEVYRCPLCGHEFMEGETEKCTVCPLAKVCNLILCPICKYEFPKTPVKRRKQRRNSLNKTF